MCVSQIACENKNKKVAKRKRETETGDEKTDKAGKKKDMLHTRYAKGREDTPILPTLIH
jgi:hypothetical protein